MSEAIAVDPVVCKHCGKALHRTLEKALDGTSEQVWTDGTNWTCDQNDGDEHEPGAFIVDAREALDAAIFGLETLRYPESSQPDDVMWLDENTDAVIRRLDLLRKEGRTPAPWYVVVERSTPQTTPFVAGEDWPEGDVVIGPFDTEAEADAHCQDSADVQDWCYGEAKAQGYMVDDVKVTQTPKVPEHGINPPVRHEQDDAQDTIRRAALLFLHGQDPEDFDLRALADALGEDHGDVEAITERSKA